MGLCETWKSLKDKYEDASVGGAKIERFKVEDQFKSFMSGVAMGEYVRLYVNGQLAMSNTDMEFRTNRDFFWDAHGDVLIGGLGIGGIIFCIQDKPEVNSITVIEKHRDVIDLITSQQQFNAKVRIICADIFEWKPMPDYRYDCIYMDIWNTISRDEYKQMKTLKRRYGHWLKSKEESPNRFNRCWAEWYAKTEHRLY